jgi:hypothetical protein
MYYLDTTKRFLAITVQNSGGFSSYATSARSGHFYYKNNVSNPWGNDGVHIGSFNLKTAGTTTFIIGNSGYLTGSLASSAIPALNPQKYTSFCNLLSAGNLDYHFLTVVVDRDKPPEVVAPSCPCYESNPGLPGNKAICPPANFTFLDGYSHTGAKITITPYYINSMDSLIAGTSLSTISYWDQTEFSALATCANLRANSPTSGRFPDVSNQYLNNSWTNGNIAVPMHGCSAFDPGNIEFGAFRYWNRATHTIGCVPASVYSFKNGIHYWGQQFSNPVGSSKAKITISNGVYGNPLSQTYYNDFIFWDSIYSSTNGAGGTGINQCPITTGQPVLDNGINRGNTTRRNILRPRYMLDIFARCNQGARTNEQDRYYTTTAGTVYGGYGFYMKFTWDALCYPCFS